MKIAIVFSLLAFAEPSSRDLIKATMDPQQCAPLLKEALAVVEAKNAEIKKLKLDIEELKLRSK